MSFLNIVTDFTGQVGVKPRIIRATTSDSFATVTTAGYLNNAIREGFTFYPTDILALSYGASPPTTSQFFTLSYSGAVITLVPSESNVVLPVVNGDFAVFSGTSGSIKDGGYSASNAAKTKVVMANSATTIGQIAVYSDTAGTIGQNASTAINNGNIQAGSATGIA